VISNEFDLTTPATAAAMIEIVDPRCVEDFVLNSGAKWADYVTSRNDPICGELESLGWKTDYELNMPWLFNPIDQDSRMLSRLRSLTLSIRQSRI